MVTPNVPPETRYMCGTDSCHTSGHTHALTHRVNVLAVRLCTKLNHARAYTHTHRDPSLLAAASKKGTPKPSFCGPPKRYPGPPCCYSSFENGRIRGAFVLALRSVSKRDSRILVADECVRAYGNSGKSKLSPCIGGSFLRPKVIHVSEHFCVAASFAAR